VPRGSDPKGALDSAMRRADDRRRGHDEEERDLALRRELEHFLVQCLDDEQFAAARDLLDQHLPLKRYGDQDRREHEADDEEERVGPDHEELRRFAEKHHLSDDAVEELGELMPHNAMHGGQGGRVHEADDRRRAARDRHRGGRDRHRFDSRDGMAGDSATDSFYRMFPEARRIGVA
jgi:hypothetical protein